MDLKLLGYRNGFAYYALGDSIYRKDYADEDLKSARWYSTKAGMNADVKANGKLCDETGLVLDLSF